MHPEAWDFVSRALAALPPRRAVVEIGGRDVNGGVKDLLNGAEYTAIDLYEGPGVDVVGDAAEWRPPAPVDTVLCLEVLEHAADAEALCRAAYEYLEPGGFLILTAAGEGRPRHSGVDGGPLREGEHYLNVTEPMLRDWLRPFRSWQIRLALTDIYALAERSR